MWHRSWYLGKVLLVALIGHVSLSSKENHDCKWEILMNECGQPSLCALLALCIVFISFFFFFVSALVNACFISFKISATLERERRNGLKIDVLKY